MSTVTTRTVCKYGHDLSTDTAVYVDKHGHRRCRTCQIASVSIRRAATRGAYNGQRRGRLQPSKFQKWAENTWAEMNDWERFIVINGLEAIPEDTT